MVPYASCQGLAAFARASRSVRTSRAHKISNFISSNALRDTDGYIDEEADLNILLGTQCCDSDPCWFEQVFQ